MSRGPQHVEITLFFSCFILTAVIFRCLHGVRGVGASLIKVDNKVQLPGPAPAVCEEHHKTGNFRPSVLLLFNACDS